MKPNRAGALGAVALTSLAVLAANAVGQSATPPVPGCAGVQLVDKKGDSTQPTTDILDVWFDRVGDKTFLNSRVAKLDLTMPQDTTFFYWSVDYTVGDAKYRFYADVRKDGTQVFGYKKFNPSGAPSPAPSGVYTKVANVPGTFFAGDKGVVQWEVPAGAGGEVGKTLTDMFAANDEVVAGDPENTGYVRKVDSIDDTTGVKSTPYTVGPCTATEPTPTPTGGDTAPPPPPAPPAQGPVTTGSGSAPTGQPQKLDIKVSRKVPRARKVRKSLKLAVSSSKGVSDVEAVLVKGSKRAKVIARGKRSSVKGKSTLRLKVTRKVKKGAYTLYVTGRNADGAGGTATVKLKFR